MSFSSTDSESAFGPSSASPTLPSHLAQRLAEEQARYRKVVTKEDSVREMQEHTARREDIIALRADAMGCEVDRCREVATQVALEQFRARHLDGEEVGPVESAPVKIPAV